MTIKLTNDKAAVVDTQLKWIPITTVPPPQNAKCLLINRSANNATLSTWKPGDWWTHWHPIPTWFTAEDDAEVQ